MAAVLGGGLRPPARRANGRARTLDEMQSVYKVALQVCFVVWPGTRGLPERAEKRLAVCCAL